MNRKRPKQIVIRTTEKEKQKIQQKVSKSTLTQNEYLLKCALAKDIYVIDGIKELTIELNKIGVNLNQLTKAVHGGKANCKEELSEINEEMKEIWQLLRLLIQKQI